MPTFSPISDQFREQSPISVEEEFQIEDISVAFLFSFSLCCSYQVKMDVYSCTHCVFVCCILSADSQFGITKEADQRHMQLYLRNQALK